MGREGTIIRPLLHLNQIPLRIRFQDDYLLDGSIQHCQSLSWM